MPQLFWLSTRVWMGGCEPPLLSCPHLGTQEDLPVKVGSSLVGTSQPFITGPLDALGV